MGFAEPLAWIFVSLAAILLYLYWRPPAQRIRVVPALFLWPQVPPPPRRPRWDLLWLLQLLALVALVAALAKPYSERQAPPQPQRHVLVVDRTASMQARDVQPSRFELAKIQAMDYLDRLRPGDLAALIAVGEQAEVLAPFSAEIAQLRARIAALEPYDSGGSLAPGLSLAQSLASESEPKARVAVFSDFAEDDVPTALFEGASLFAVGSGNRNVGIESVEVAQRPWQRAGEAKIVVQVRNYGDQVEHGLLIVEWEGRALLRQGFTLRPRDHQALAIEQVAGPGQLTIDIVSDDFLTTDNHAQVRLTDPDPLRVCWVSAQMDQWADLQKLAAAWGRLRLAGRSCASGSEPTDVYVFHRVRPPQDLATPAVVMDPPPTGSGPVGPVYRDVPVLAWDGQQPIFASWNPSFPLPLHSARRSEPPEGARPLLWGRLDPATDVIAWWREQPARQVWLGFDLTRENILSTEGFSLSVFFLESLAWLHPRLPAGGAWPAGRPFPVPGPTRATVVLPNGQEYVLPPGVSSFVPHWRGRYEVRSAHGDVAFYVSALDPRESNIAPRPPRIGVIAPGSPPEETVIRIPWNDAVLAAALGLLLLEAWLASRRQTRPAG